MARRTIAVNDVVTTINAMLRDSDYGKRPERRAMQSLAESILHQTGNYRGFRYLLQSEIPEGNPGVNYTNGQLNDPETRFVNTDDSRVHYFTN